MTSVCPVSDYLPKIREGGKEVGRKGEYYLIGISNQFSLKRMGIKLLPMAHRANEDQMR